MMQIIFFAVSVLVLFAGHAALWYVFISFFSINFWSGRVIAALVVAFLFFSTVIASYLIHQWDNIFTRWYYMATGFWIGLLINLGVMTALIIIIKIINSSLSLSLPSVYLKIIFIGGALLLSAVGVYRAWSPVVTEYEVAIKDLPVSWEGKTIVHISDVHLGPVYRVNFFSRLVKRINGLNPEAIFITGDLFDGMEADFSWLDNPLGQMVAPRGIYYGFGNHDLYLGFSQAKALMEKSRVRILDNELTIVDGLQIIGISYSFDSNLDLERAILKQVGYQEDRPSILMLHVPKNIPLAKKAGIDLQLSGHTHDGQIFPFNLLAKWMHAGYGYGLFTEGDFSLIVNGGAGTWGPPMRTAARSEVVKLTLKKK
jgi:hypothetical protein